MVPVAPELFSELEPEPRLLMGPGPVDVYPRVLRGPDDAEDYANPLRLLAQAIAFTDPVTGEARSFQSQRALDWPV